MINQDYDPFQFHDNSINGIIFPPYDENARSELHLDIDHILDWVYCSPIEGESIFSVSKGLLKFHNVTDLIININWGDSKYTSSASREMIVEIQREKVSTTLGYPEYYKWTIVTNSDDYVISFGASSMSLELIGQPIEVNRQYLLSSERN